jgi:ADP-heptose:LPS heptosyltransferase
MGRPHVLVVRLDNLGDVLLTGPAIRAVAASARRVTFLAGPSGSAAAKLLPGVDDVVVFNAPWVAFDAPPVDRGRIDELIDQVAGLAVDEAFVFTSYHQSPLLMALLLRMAGVGSVSATSVDFPGRLLDVRHATIDGHEVEEALSLVETRGFRLAPGDDGRLRIDGPLIAEPPFDSPYVVVHPGASVPARRIPEELATATIALLTEIGWSVAVTGGASEAATTARCAAAGSPGRVVDLTGRLDLRQLAGVIAGASALVVANTGPAHLAAAVDTPVVSVFAPVVDATRWAPWRVPSVVLGDQHIDCAGCRARACPLSEQRCISGVTARDIVGAVARIARSSIELPA